MPNTKISALPANATPATSDVVPIVSGATNQKATLGSLPISAAVTSALALKADASAIRYDFSLYRLLAGDTQNMSARRRLFGPFNNGYETIGYYPTEGTSYLYPLLIVKPTQIELLDINIISSGAGNDVRFFICDSSSTTYQPKDVVWTHNDIINDSNPGQHSRTPAFDVSPGIYWIGLFVEGIYAEYESIPIGSLNTPTIMGFHKGERKPVTHYQYTDFGSNTIVGTTIAMSGVTSQFSNFPVVYCRIKP